VVVRYRFDLGRLQAEEVAPGLRDEQRRAGPDVEPLDFRLHGLVSEAPRRNRGAEVAHAAIAGHHPIVRIAPGGAITLIENRMLPLGLAPEEVVVTNESFEPVNGEFVACSTDGPGETSDDRGRQLGHAAILETLSRTANCSQSEIAEAVSSLAGAHGAQDDDRPLLLVRARRPGAD